ncbi:MAG: hypothetical protein AB1641_03925 [Thermodesulfobacteriota bacterium]
MDRLRLRISVFSAAALLLVFLGAQVGEGCPACWSGYGPGDERYNKPLADLRIIYEQKGAQALPYIREALKTSTDPLVIKRAAGYLVTLDDKSSINTLRSILLEIIKRVAFTTFGPGTNEFQSRLAIAHALPQLAPTDTADQMWERYERLDRNRKAEIPYILNALKDPLLDERMKVVLGKEEDHQLMIGALEALAAGGTPAIVPYLRGKVEQWRGQSTGPEKGSPGEPSLIYYVPLRIKAEQAIRAIEGRNQ